MRTRILAVLAMVSIAVGLIAVVASGCKAKDSKSAEPQAAPAGSPGPGNTPPVSGPKAK